MSYAIVDSIVRSVHSDDVTHSMHDWQVFKVFSIEDNLSIVLLGFWIQSRINDLKGANVSILTDLVGEGRVNNYTIEVL